MYAIFLLLKVWIVSGGFFPEKPRFLPSPAISQRILVEDNKKDSDGQPSSSASHHLPKKSAEEHTMVANPLLAAWLLSSTLGIEPVSSGFNHFQHPHVNPYVSLLLSHYGRYVPLQGVPGIYGHAAANNYHNNQPVGAYKIHEDRDT